MPRWSGSPVGSEGEEVNGRASLLENTGENKRLVVWGAELEGASLPQCRWHRAELHWMVEGPVRVYVYPTIYMSIFSVYTGDKFILKAPLTGGVNAQCSVEHCAKAMNRFVLKDCLKAAFSIQCSVECHRNAHIRFILRVHHSL